MSVLESMLVALFLLLVVFAALIGLYAAVRCFTHVLNRTRHTTDNNDGQATT